MSIKVALHHRTQYRYERPIQLGPQLIRLRPAAHCRTPILSYSLKVQPAEHFVNWQQDPHSNFVARYVFPKPTDHFIVDVDLVADMTVINPFDFFLEDDSRHFPLAYEVETERDLRAFLEVQSFGPNFQAFLKSIPRTDRGIIDFLVELNLRLQQEVKYLIRLEPGVQTPEETLTLKSGSCRDSAWLLVQLLRHLGLAARFVSGYLIQLVPDVKSLDGPTGAEADFTDLHAWTEVFVPGAGWIGLDPTSGLLAGEGHIPLAATPDPSSAAPITGLLEACEAEFEHVMLVTRVMETPRVTKPYRDETWQEIDSLGSEIDRRLQTQDVRLTMGGEPTFVSIDDMDGAQWNTAAVGVEKRILSEKLIRRLQQRFAPGGLLHYGAGKWYPGESLPRWALTCYWRKDGLPIWQDQTLIAEPDRVYNVDRSTSENFLKKLAEVLDVHAQYVVPVFEDPLHHIHQEQRLPVNIDPLKVELDDPEERVRLAKALARGLNQPSGHILPLRRAWWQTQASRLRWVSGVWPVRSEKFFLIPGDSPIGLRLPLDSLPVVPTAMNPWYIDAEMGQRPPLPVPHYQQASVPGAAAARGEQGISHQMTRDEMAEERRLAPQEFAPAYSIRTAICAQVREGRLHLFMPPTETMEDYLDLLAAVEATARIMNLPVVIEGYLPVQDPRVQCIKVTPDPGVIEVNIHPNETWEALRDSTTALYEEARLTRLGTDKFDLDGRHSGTGGGNHIVLGAATPLDSPFLRRPDLLRSFLGYWVNHPSLSYMFSSRFIGPTSQAPRVDEGRRDSLYELEVAFQQLPPVGQACPAWIVDRIFRNLLIDLTGNTHRAEFCIDKLYSPDSHTGRLGLVELRGFEMPPHAQMSLAQQLLIRGLVAKFWEQPWDKKLIEWGTTLHDRFMLSHYVWQDFCEVIEDLCRAGMPFQSSWFQPHLEFRFPLIGKLEYQDIQLELRAGIEPWYVLGEEPAGGGTVRFVDSSLERLQVKATGLFGDRYRIACNRRQVPMHSTGVPGHFVGGVRYKAWHPPSGLHPTIGVHTPLVFDLVDTWTGRSVAGCTYHVSHPAGRNYATFPVNANEAEARRAARFFSMGHTPGPMNVQPEPPNPAYPSTLDLRWQPSRS
ncbi:MAG: transglutaminase family protein [Planctomycetaceae bacterium]|nr:transglutaminase family protein [Planctomycetaceae bacterium]